MLKFYKIIFCFLILTVSAFGFAEDPVLIKCHLTPEIEHIEKIPASFSSNNNLRRSANSLYVAKGQSIHIVGRLSDENCVPIANATVHIWHNNAYGEIQTSSKDSSSKSFDKNFAGTGSAVTDNLGYYRFITVLPNSAIPVNKLPSPYINFMVSHKDFAPLETKMFFSTHFNKIILSLSKNSRNLLIAKEVNNNVYEFNITLAGKNKHLTY